MPGCTNNFQTQFKYIIYLFSIFVNALNVSILLPLSILILVYLGVKIGNFDLICRSIEKSTDMVDLGIWQKFTILINFNFTEFVLLKFAQFVTKFAKFV